MSRLALIVGLLLFNLAGCSGDSAPATDSTLEQQRAELDRQRVELEKQQTALAQERQAIELLEQGQEAEADKARQQEEKLAADQKQQQAEAHEAEAQQARKLLEEQKEIHRKAAAIGFFEFRDEERVRLAKVDADFGVTRNDRSTHVPTFDDPDYKTTPIDVGFAGVVSSLGVIQIIDDSTFLARFGKTPFTVLARGWDTTSFVDGSRLAPPGIWISGTQDYQSVQGASKRVFVIEPIDLEAYEKEYQP